MKTKTKRPKESFEVGKIYTPKTKICVQTYKEIEGGDFKTEDFYFNYHSGRGEKNSILILKKFENVAVYDFDDADEFENDFEIESPVTIYKVIRLYEAEKPFFIEFCSDFEASLLTK